MLIKIYVISTMLTLFSVDLSRCDTKSKTKKITVIGTAILTKSFAAVRTDDSLTYYLDGIYSWDDKYYKKRVKVTGKLYLKQYRDSDKSSDPEITLIPQKRYGIYRIIKKPKWSLDE